MDEITLTLNSPITEEEWDMITDVDLDHTSEMMFHTKHGKGVRFVKEPHWIPCSERLPRYDETSEYLVTDKDGRVRHCCLDPYMPETFVTVEEGMIVDAVAWRPAPEPYCKTESHEREGE